MLNINQHYNHKIVAIMLLILFFLQAFFTTFYKSPSYDEPAHLARGLIYLKTGYIMIAAHPPLMHILSSVPLLFIDIHLPNDYKEYLLKNDLSGLGQETFYTANNNSNMVFFLARIPLILLGVVLGIYVYKWAKELYGINAGIFALLIYSFSPLILGNTSLILTDMTLTCFGFISVYHLWKFQKSMISEYSKSIIHLILAGLNTHKAMAR